MFQSRSLTVALLAFSSLTFGAPLADQSLDTTITTLAKRDNPWLLAGPGHGKCDDGVWRDGACYCSSGCIQKTGVCHKMYGECSAGASTFSSSAMNGLAIAASVVIGTTIDMPISFALVTIAALIPNTLAAPHPIIPLPATDLPDIEERSETTKRDSRRPLRILIPDMSRSIFTGHGKCVHGSWRE